MTRPTSRCAVAGCTLYRAVDAKGKTVDFYLSRTRDKNAARVFFRKVSSIMASPVHYTRRI